MEKSKKEQVNQLTTINFSITKCPHKVFEEFVGFCAAETNDNYSMGIKLLLDARRTNIKEVILYEQYMELKNELADLKKKLFEEEQKETTKKRQKPKTFGSK